MWKLKEVIENPPILIGSKAIKYYFPDFPREPKDTDYIMYEYQEFGNLIKEPEVEYLKNAIISNKYHKSGKSIIDKDDLCTLKASHLCWDINWSKHMFDLQFLLKKGCKIDPKLFFRLYQFWNMYHSQNKRSDLKMTKSEFFDNAINYDEGEHDYLHTLLNPIPIYTKVLKDGCEVELDENKFNNLTYEDKLNFIREEVMVMAYERMEKLNYRVAYDKMLKKFIISHAPIWSLVFILENYLQVLKPDRNFIKIIENELRKDK